jgi:hypothetical protein
MPFYSVTTSDDARYEALIAELSVQPQTTESIALVDEARVQLARRQAGTGRHA